MGRGERKERIEREKEGEVRGEQKRKAWPQQVCLGADYSNTPKQIIFFLTFKTESQYTAQVGTELPILLPQTPGCWPYR